MGYFRFQRRIKIGPGVHLNLNKGMPSISVGGHGLTANFSKRGLMTTASIPGTGLSYRHRWGNRRPSQRELKARVKSLNDELRQLDKGQFDVQKVRRAVAITDEMMALSELIQDRKSTRLNSSHRL